MGHTEPDCHNFGAACNSGRDKKSSTISANFLHVCIRPSICLSTYKMVASQTIGIFVKYIVITATVFKEIGFDPDSVHGVSPNDSEI